MHKGLTAAEVLTSREKHGENAMKATKRLTLFERFIANFSDPIIKILLAALAINIIFLFKDADWMETVGIAIAILLATVVSTISEAGSESAFVKLQEDADKIYVRVWRSGELTAILLREVVVGDIIEIASGDKVPADGVMIEGALEVDQSALNGESKEAKKMAGDDSPFASADFLDYAHVFAGTVCVAGEGVMKVTSVGDETFLGQMAGELQEEVRVSPLKLRLGEFAGTISKFGYAAAAAVALAFLAREFFIMHTVSSLTDALSALIQAATIAVTVIVMAVPEGLPMMITIVLTSNMKKMLADNVLVRKLVGIETAGSLNILFTDKTGTITRGKLEVARVVGNEDEDFFANIFYNNSAKIGAGGLPIGGNATDRALLEYANLSSIPSSNIVKLGSVPFDSKNKYMSTTIMKNGEKIVLYKGAAEKILPLCTGCDKNDIRREIAEMTAAAMRVIVVAQGACADETAFSSNEHGQESETAEFLGGAPLEFVAAVGIRDEVREEATDSVAKMQSAGVQVVMITGDSAETARAIAREVGILRQGELVLESRELAQMSDEELSEKLPRLRVVARALPGDKSRLVRIAQNRDLVVGMTGDGVNDAPALRKADVGFAMGSGTEVAKEAGDIIILDDNLRSICKAILYGRTVFKNIRKFIVYQLTISMGAVGVSVIAPFIGISSPITVIQMLWINIVMDTLSGIAFSGEKAREAYMKEAPKARDEKVLDRYMWNQIAVCAVGITAISIWFLKSTLLPEKYLLTGFFALFMFTAVFMSFCARTRSLDLLEYLAANKAFIWIMGLVCLVQVAMIYVGGKVFRTVPLKPLDLAFVLGVASMIVAVDLGRKATFRARRQAEHINC